MILLVVFQICIGALCGAFTIVGLMVAYLALCAVCKAIAETLREMKLPR